MLRCAVRVPTTPREARHATQDPPDRRPRRRGLLDGEGRLPARRLHPVAHRRAHGRGSASCPPPRATPTTTSCASTAASPPAARRATCPCSAATRAPAGSRTTSPTHLLAAGPDLRRRRQHGEHARRLARARARRDPAQGLAPGHRPVRALGRLAVLVRAGPERLPRRPAARCAASACCPTRTASTTTPSPPGARSTTASSATACAPGSPSRTASACTSAAPARAGRQLASRRPRLPGAGGQSGRVVRDAVLDRRVPRRAPGAAPGRRRGRTAAPERLQAPSRRVSRAPAVCRSRSGRSSRWAAAASRWSRPTRCSTTSCSAGARPRAARSCSCPRPRATPPRQINAFKARFADRTCVPEHLSLFRLREIQAPARASSSLEQDILYVGGGSMRNLLAIWRAHELDRLLIEAWRTGAPCWQG